MQIDDLLATAKDRCQPANYSGLAAALGVEPSAVSNWRHGRALPDGVSCSKIAVLTGEPLARVIGVVGEQRAVSREAKAVWRRLATAAAVLLAVGFSGFPVPVQAGLNAGESMHYAKWHVLCRRLHGWLLSLAGRFFPDPKNGPSALLA
jgi:transcriptional regulator with XRE-family HTH domain